MSRGKRRRIRHQIRAAQKHGRKVNVKELASCYGKIRHTKHEARKRAQETPTMVAYDCRYCDYWHVGRKQVK